MGLEKLYNEDIMLSVVKAVYMEEYMIKVEFSNGDIKLCDFKKVCDFSGVFSTLLNLDKFKQFYIEDGVLYWSEMLDCCPDTLYMKGELVCQ